MTQNRGAPQWFKQVARLVARPPRRSLGLVQSMRTDYVGKARVRAHRRLGDSDLTQLRRDPAREKFRWGQRDSGRLTLQHQARVDRVRPRIWDERDPEDGIYEQDPGMGWGLGGSVGGSVGGRMIL